MPHGIYGVYRRVGVTISTDPPGGMREPKVCGLLCGFFSEIRVTGVHKITQDYNAIIGISNS